MANQEYPFVWLPEEPKTSTIAKLAPNSLLRLAPNRALWKAQDSIPGQSRRVLAEYHLDGSNSWAVPAGTVDPDTGAVGKYPSDATWRTVAAPAPCRLTPGCKLEMRVLFCPAGLTEGFDMQVHSEGAWAEIRARVTWRNGTNVSGPHDFTLTMPGSGKGTWGGAENTEAGSDWATLDEKVHYDIMPPGYETDPEVTALYSENTEVRIMLQVRGGERIVHAIVYEVPSVHVQDHDAPGPFTVHGAPPGEPQKPKRPQTDAKDGSFENHRWGTTRVLQAAERQAARLGPRILTWASNTHSTSAWSVGDQSPTTVSGSATALRNMFNTSLSGYNENHPGWIVAGSMAQLHRLNAEVMMRGRAAVVPVKVTVDCARTTSPSTLRLQSSEYEWVEIPIPPSRAEVVRYGYLASQVYPDQFRGILLPLVTVPNDGTVASIYNITVDFLEGSEDVPQPFKNIVVLQSDVTNNNGSANTMQDVTGLEFDVVAGATYKFRFVIQYTAAATTTGSRWSINGPSTTSLRYTSTYSLSATTQTTNHGLTSYDAPASSNTGSAATGGNIAIIEGFVTPSASGTVIARFASEVSSSAIIARAGSTLEWERVL